MLIGGTLTKPRRFPVDWANGRLLSNRPFRTVAGGEVLSMLGDYAYQVPFAWLVLTVTGSALAWHFYAMAADFGLADAFFWPARGASCRT
jgi:hypothetical protein